MFVEPSDTVYVKENLPHLYLHSLVSLSPREAVVEFRDAASPER